MLRRCLVPLVLALLAPLALAPAASARAAKRLPDGATIAGVAVGGLGPAGTERTLRHQLGQSLGRPVLVRVGHRTRPVLPARAGLSVEYESMLRRAFWLAGRGRPVAVPLARTLDLAGVTAAVRGVGRAFYRAPRDARVRYGVAAVVRIRHRHGRGVDVAPLRRALVGELLRPTEARVVQAGLRRIPPRVTTGELARRHGTYLSVDRRTFTLRLFKRLRVVRRYRVAVGGAGYATPSGLYRIESKQVNPAWYVPRRAWAGSLAGQVIPAGDPRNPLKARFLAIAGGVGIHGTAQGDSIGTAASHGCIRMRVRDVKLLYERVPLFTPILIR